MQKGSQKKLATWATAHEECRIGLQAQEKLAGHA